MSKLVPADIEINIKIAQDAIEESFSVPVKKIETMGEGWDNIVFLVNENIVFRFSRRIVAVSLLKREMQVLGKIANKLNLFTPEPIYQSEGCSSYAYPFYGHDLIVGTTGCRVILNSEEYRQAAETLGVFLKQLHSIELFEVKSLTDTMTPVFDRIDVARMMETFLSRLKDLEEVYDFSAYAERIQEIQLGAQNYKYEGQMVFVHGDLYHRHLIFKENKLSGVIDWGDCCVTDPVVDFGVLFQFFPSEVHHYFWDAYGPVNEEMKCYARFLGLYYAIALLWYGHDKQDDALIDTSLQTLKMI